MDRVRDSLSITQGPTILTMFFADTAAIGARSVGSDGKDVICVGGKSLMVGDERMVLRRENGQHLGLKASLPRGLCETRSLSCLGDTSTSTGKCAREIAVELIGNCGIVCRLNANLVGLPQPSIRQIKMSTPDDMPKIWPRSKWTPAQR